MAAFKPYVDSHKIWWKSKRKPFWRKLSQAIDLPGSLSTWLLDRVIQKLPLLSDAEKAQIHRSHVTPLISVGVRIDWRMIQLRTPVFNYMYLPNNKRNPFYAQLYIDGCLVLGEFATETLNWWSPDMKKVHENAPQQSYRPHYELVKKAFGADFDKFLIELARAYLLHDFTIVNKLCQAHRFPWGLSSLVLQVAACGRYEGLEAEKKRSGKSGVSHIGGLYQNAGIITAKTDQIITLWFGLLAIIAVIVPGFSALWWIALFGLLQNLIHELIWLRNVIPHELIHYLAENEEYDGFLPVIRREAEWESRKSS